MEANVMILFVAILFSIIPMAIGMVILYFVIKLAVKNGIKEYEDSKLK